MPLNSLEIQTFCCRNKELSFLPLLYHVTMNPYYVAMSDQSGQLQKINLSNFNWLLSSLSQDGSKTCGLLKSGVKWHQCKVMMNADDCKLSESADELLILMVALNHFLV